MPSTYEEKSRDDRDTRTTTTPNAYVQDIAGARVTNQTMIQNSNKLKAIPEDGSSGSQDTNTMGGRSLIYPGKKRKEELNEWVRNVNRDGHRRTAKWENGKMVEQMPDGHRFKPLFVENYEGVTTHIK